MLQPLRVAKETSAGIKTRLDLSGPSPSTCVCFATNKMWVCVCVSLLALRVYTTDSVKVSK